jgi:hypothetical protein
MAENSPLFFKNPAEIIEADEKTQKKIDEHYGEAQQAEHLMTLFVNSMKNLGDPYFLKKRYLHRNLNFILTQWIALEDSFDPDGGYIILDSTPIPQKAKIKYFPSTNAMAHQMIHILQDRSFDEEMANQLIEMPSNPLLDEVSHEKYLLGNAENGGEPHTLSLLRREFTNSSTVMNTGFSISQVNGIKMDFGDVIIHEAGNFLGKMFGSVPDQVRFFVHERTHWVIHGLDPKLPEPSKKEAIPRETLDVYHSFHRYPDADWTTKRDYLDGLSVLDYLYIHGWKALKNHPSCWEEMSKGRNKPKFGAEVMFELFARIGIFPHKTLAKDELTRKQNFQTFMNTSSSEEKKEILNSYFGEKFKRPLFQRTHYTLRKKFPQDRAISAFKPSMVKYYSTTRQNNATFSRIEKILTTYQTYFEEGKKDYLETIRKLYFQTIASEIKSIQHKIKVSLDKIQECEKKPPLTDWDKSVLENEKNRLAYLTNLVLSQLEFMRKNPTPSVEDFHQKTGYLPNKVSETRQRLWLETQHVGTQDNPTQDNASLFYLKTHTEKKGENPNKSSTHSKLIFRDNPEIDKKEGGLLTPKADLEELASLFFKEKITVESLIEYQQNSQSIRPPKEQSPAEKFWAFWNSKLKDPRDNVHIRPEFLSLSAFFTLQSLQNPEKILPWYQKSLEIPKQHRKNGAVFSSKAGDEFRAIFKLNGQYFFLNIDLGSFQNIDSKTEELGIRTAKDTLYHSIMDHLLTILSEECKKQASSGKTNPETLLQTMADLEKKTAEIHLNPHFVSDSSFIQSILAYLKETIQILDEDLKILKGKKNFSDLHFFDKISETRSPKDYEVEAMIQRNQGIKKQLEITRNRITEDLSSLEEKGLLLEEETLLSEAKKEQKRQLMDWTIDIKNFLVPSTTKIGTERVNNSHHFKRLKIYAALTPVPAPDEDPLDYSFYEKLVESQLQTDSVVELLKKTGVLDVHFLPNTSEAPKIPEAEPGFLSENFFLDSEKNVLSTPLIDSLTAQINTVTGTQYSNEIIANALDYFLYSTEEASFDPSKVRSADRIGKRIQPPYCFFKPYRGRALSKDSIVKKWNELFRNIFSTSNTLEKNYQKIVRMVGIAFDVTDSASIKQAA